MAGQLGVAQPFDMKIGMPFWSLTSAAISAERLSMASASRRNTSALAVGGQCDQPRHHDHPVLKLHSGDVNPGYLARCLASP
jgi:hypothetical protein